MIRIAEQHDIPIVKQIADANKDMLGFVNRSALQRSVERGCLLVAEYDGAICGFANIWKRRDGWTTVYEICVSERYRRQGIGRRLLDNLDKPVRLKCTTENPANSFYIACGFTLVRVERGKKRELNVWECAELHM